MVAREKNHCEVAGSVEVMGFCESSSIVGWICGDAAALEIGMHL